jgi:hypothetical protein
MQSENRRPQIFDDPEKARFATKASSDNPQSRNDRLPKDPQLQDDRLPEDTLRQDSWVHSFMGRLAALVRDVGGRDK